MNKDLGKPEFCKHYKGGFWADDRGVCYWQGSYQGGYMSCPICNPITRKPDGKEAEPSDWKNKIKELFYKVQKGYHPSNATGDAHELIDDLIAKLKSWGIE